MLDITHIKLGDTIICKNECGSTAPSFLVRHEKGRVNGLDSNLLYLTSKESHINIDNDSYGSECVYLHVDAVKGYEIKPGRLILTERSILK